MVSARMIFVLALAPLPTHKVMRCNNSRGSVGNPGKGLCERLNGSIGFGAM